MISRIAPLFMMLAAVALLAGSCAGFPKTTGRGPKRFTLIVTGGTAGALEPQGCACRRLGGMARRAGLIARERSPGAPVLVLDSGNLLFRPGTPAGREDLDNAQCLLNCAGRMHTAALNVSARDCAAGADFLKKNAAATALISSNLQDGTTGEPLFAPFLTTALSGVRIGIFGLTGRDGSSAAHGIRVEDPAASARRAVSALQRADCDVIVLLSQLTGEQNRQLLAEVSGIHFVLGSCDEPPDDSPARAGDGYTIAPGQHGTHAAVLDCMLEGRGPAFEYAGGTRSGGPDARQVQPGKPPSRGRFTVRLAALDGSVPADPDMEPLLETCREEHVRRDLQARHLRYNDSVPAVDMSGLDESGKKRAVRLMNELSCPDRSIAQCAADTQLCRDMGLLVVKSVRAGLSDGTVRFKVLRAMQARERPGDIPLDKPARQ